MKAKVLIKFKDKYTGEIYEQGATITVNEKRFKEILTVGDLVEEIKSVEAETEKKPRKKSAK